MVDARIAIIRIHGKKGLKKGIKDTFNMLRLYNKHNCVIIKNTDGYIGMLKKVKNYVTWGEIDKETLVSLLQKRGKLARKKSLTEEYVQEKSKLSIDEFSSRFLNFQKELKDIPGIKQFFKLSPPKGGFEKGGIKKEFTLGGSLGYRMNKINDLIKRML